MPLSDIELRVVGALVEKERTTPEGYPLSNQALVTACNQRTSRDPVTDYHLQDVMEAVQRLRDRGLVATVQEVSDRVPKHRHRLVEALDVDGRELALLAVLMLRGSQTPGELRGRTERYLEGSGRGFADVAEVEATLAAMAARRTPLVRNLGRGAGQSQDRWQHTLGADEQRMQPRVRGRTDEHHGAAHGADHAAEPNAERVTGQRAEQSTQGGAGSAAGRPDGDVHAALEALEARVARLEERLARAERTLVHGD